jgi:hypothetical protein
MDKQANNLLKLVTTKMVQLLHQSENQQQDMKEVEQTLEQNQLLNFTPSQSSPQSWAEQVFENNHLFLNPDLSRLPALAKQDWKPTPDLTSPQELVNSLLL